MRQLSLMDWYISYELQVRLLPDVSLADARNELHSNIQEAVGYGGGLFGLFLHGKGRQVDGQFIPQAMSAFGGGGT